MRILRFKRIRRVARFRDTAMKGEQLGRAVIVLAGNARGKSTLCAILRSLDTGNPAPIVERATLGPGEDPLVEIQLEDKRIATFNGSKWGGPKPKIEIFDETFIAANVHGGDTIRTDHKRRLMDVILGEEGGAIKGRVTALDEAIKAQNAKVTAAEAELRRHVGADTDLQAFVAMVPDASLEALDAKVNAATRARDEAKASDRIRDERAPAPLQRPLLPSAVAVLGETLDGVLSAAEASVQMHIARHRMGSGGEPWILNGLGFVQDDACPFCGQGLAGNALLPAFKQYFSEAYAKLRGRIDTLRHDIDEHLGAAAIERLKGTAERNATLQRFWAQFSTARVEEFEPSASLAPAIERLRSGVAALVDRKAGALLDPIDFAKELANELTSLEEACGLLDRYNASVAVLAAEIGGIKARTPSGALEQASRALAEAERARLRAAPGVRASCDKLSEARAELARLTQEKDTAKRALDDHSSSVIESFEGSINEHLKKFGASISLGLGPSYVGREPTTKVELVVDEHKVDPGAPEQPPGKPSFRTVMSAGDRSSLALAYFLAKADRMGDDLGSRILVFDDPFSSLDAVRREATASAIVRYADRCAQLIVLSHDNAFAKLVHERLKARKIDIRMLEIGRASRGRDSVIVDLTLDELNLRLRDSFTMNRQQLNDFLETIAPDAKKCLAGVLAMRQTIEGWILRACPVQLPKNAWLGTMIDKIRKGEILPGLARRLSEIEEINDYSCKFHHDDGSPLAGAGVPNADELARLVRQALDLVAESAGQHTHEPPP